MKYVIWFVRFWYVAWMIPAGLEHFYHIYPQPGANSPHPLAAEMLTALLHSNLFDLVKAVELIKGTDVAPGFVDSVVEVSLEDRLRVVADGSGPGRRYWCWCLENHLLQRSKGPDSTLRQPISRNR